jgi:hypothetical protein
VHGPQLIGFPQPSLAIPQLKPNCAQVIGVHVPKPQTLGTLFAPHVWPELHVPQLIGALQPLFTVPQLYPSCAHVFGVHPPSVPASAPVEQTPALHMPDGQKIPQLPQLVGSLLTSVHVGPHILIGGKHVPLSDIGLPQMPALQTPEQHGPALHAPPFGVHPESKPASPMVPPTHAPF